MTKRSVLTLGSIGFVLGSVWLVRWVQNDIPTETPTQIILADEAAQSAFLAEQGQTDCRLSAVEQVQLPILISGIYVDYVALQEQQNLPLSTHLGETATRYTYTQQNSEQGIQYTELLFDENQVLIGAMQYNASGTEMTAVLS